MRGAIIKLREDRKERLTEDFKYKHGYKKLTDKRREELKAETSNDSEVELYTAILEELV
jgi:hypothetical protein